ncbi:MAG: hypothetical protein L7U72_14370, partial [Rubripirellula sp.]|nr:hypothetical protein [Rubripirellula sp.]
IEPNLYLLLPIICAKKLRWGEERLLWPRPNKRENQAKQGKTRGFIPDRVQKDNLRNLITSTQMDVRKRQ